nr:hypothetical protein CFP56_41306 [Quercus suber]
MQYRTRGESLETITGDVDFRCCPESSHEVLPGLAVRPIPDDTYDPLDFINPVQQVSRGPRTNNDDWGRRSMALRLGPRTADE